MLTLYTVLGQSSYLSSSESNKANFYKQKINIKKKLITFSNKYINCNLKPTKFNYKKNNFI